MAYPFESSIKLTNAACQLLFSTGNSYIDEASASVFNIYTTSTNMTFQDGSVGPYTLTQLAAMSGGDVTATPTPLDGQVAIWTGATNLEGDAQLTFDTADDSLHVGQRLGVGHTLAAGDIAGFQSSTNHRFFVRHSGTNLWTGINLDSNSGTDSMISFSQTAFKASMGWDDATATLRIVKGGGAALDTLENMAVFTPDGAVTLYWDNAEKLATSSAGGTLTGTWNATTDLTVGGTSVSLDGHNHSGDGYVTKSGTMNGSYVTTWYSDGVVTGSSALQFNGNTFVITPGASSASGALLIDQYNTGANDGFRMQGSTTAGQLYLDASDKWILARNSVSQISIGTTEVTLNHTGSAKLATSSTGVEVTGVTASFYNGSNNLFSAKKPSNTATDYTGYIFELYNSVNAYEIYGRLYTAIVTNTSTAEDGKMYFQVMDGGTLTSKMSLDQDGKLRLNESASSYISMLSDKTVLHYDANIYDTINFVTSDDSTSGPGTITATTFRITAPTVNLGTNNILSIGNGNEIWSDQNADNDSTYLYINYRGYAGGTTRRRSTIIADGKGNTILSLNAVNTYYLNNLTGYSAINETAVITADLTIGNDGSSCSLLTKNYVRFYGRGSLTQPWVNQVWVYDDTPGYGAGTGGGFTFSFSYTSGNLQTTGGYTRGYKLNSNNGNYDSGIALGCRISTANGGAPRHVFKMEGQGLMYAPYINTGTTSYPVYWTLNTGEIVRASSDRRLKENIKDWSYDSLGLLRKLSIKRFDWKNKELEQDQLGWIAQDMLEIEPEMVGQDNDGYYAIRERHFLQHFHQAINQLAIRSESHGERIDRLEKENKHLKEEIHKLKNAS